MSYAAPFSLLSLHVPERDESVAERLRWPLAGSALLHAVVVVALLGLRFGSSLEQSDGAYEVTLVTLPEIASPAPPVTKTKPDKNVEKVPPPKAKAKKTPAVAPKVVPPPISKDPMPIPKQNVEKLPPPPVEDVREVPKPERVTESLVSALDAVVVPKTQTLPLPQESAPVRPPAPVEQSPAVEEYAPAFKAPPQPPKLVVSKSSKSPTPTPAPTPSVDLLTPKLKRAVSATSVPKKLKQVSKRVTPAVTPKRQQKPDTPKAPESPSITLPARPPRLAAVAPPETRKKKTPLQTVRKSSTVESLKEAIQSVKVPQGNPKNRTVPVKKAMPLVSETPPPAKAAKTRTQSLRKRLAPQAPQLAEVRTPAPSEPMVPDSASEPDTSPRQEIDPSIPDLSAFNPQQVSKYTESGGKKAQGLWQAGLCAPTHPYWRNVEARIDAVHGNIYRYHYDVEYPAILTFRVTRNGQVTDLDVFQPSGNKKFDEIAKRAVLAAVPLPPFPASMTKPFCQVIHEFKIRPN
ncbi:MAG: TonB family protein [Nitrospira sp. SB0675_bin_23]|nr:TonB family protein [Nitrospira sp. SB0675_bin_23]